MNIFKTLGVVAFLSLGAAACAVAPSDNDEAAASANESALSGTGATCYTDATCMSADVCDLHCPSIPGRAHCEIAGGTCQLRCSRTTSSLHGESFTSANGAHSITFAADGTFRKTDGCDPSPSGIRCMHIQLTTGTYHSSPAGKVITLTSSLGGTDTLSVEPHCYDGLLDANTGVELYPNP